MFQFCHEGPWSVLTLPNLAIQRCMKAKQSSLPEILNLNFVQDSLVIISRLDEVSTGAACRLALYGRLTGLIDPNSPTELSKLKVFKVKQKAGSIERLLASDGSLAVCRGFFKKESDFSPFIGLQAGFHKLWVYGLICAYSHGHRCNKILSRCIIWICAMTLRLLLFLSSHALKSQIQLHWFILFELAKHSRSLVKNVSSTVHATSGSAAKSTQQSAMILLLEARAGKIASEDLLCLQVLAELKSIVQVRAAGGEVGRIESTFGKSGKFRVRFQQNLPVPLPDVYKLTLTFKKYVFSKDQKRIVQ